MVDQSEILRHNVHSVRHRIEQSAERSGRNADAITLVAITKYVSADVAAALVHVGCRDLGESRPQELWTKADALHDHDIRWHLVGHLQRNKVKRTLQSAQWIHSVDSQRLLKAIEHHAAESSLVVNVLLEVNVSGETAKHGFEPDAVESTFEFLGQAQFVKVHGLMCMAGLQSNADQTRTEFAKLRELMQRLEKVAPANVDLTDLSMGMSGDFEIAIEEGATIVRIGSILFEGLL